MTNNIEGKLDKIIELLEVLIEFHASPIITENRIFEAPALASKFDMKKCGIISGDKLISMDKNSLNKLMICNVCKLEVREGYQFECPNR